MTVGLPGKGDEESKEVRTDPDGLTDGFTEAGRYCVAAVRVEQRAGEFGGKKFSTVRHTATIVFDFGKPSR